MGRYALWVALRQKKRAMLQAVIRRWRNRLAGPDRRSSLQQEQAGQRIVQYIGDALSYAKPRKLERGNRPLRLVHFVGQLGPGGSERQLCNCAIASRRLGYDVSVLLLTKPTGDFGHYARMLSSHNIPVRVAGEHFDPAFRSAVNELPGREAGLAAIPEQFFPWTIDVLGELLADPPDIFHSWLDHANTWGGLAAVLANVPLVVLSTRSVNPTHFPHLSSPHLHPAYVQLARSPSVRFVSNTRAGAEDYAKWLELPKERFPVVLNGIDFGEFSRAGREDEERFRKQNGIPQEMKIIAGVFRLSEEKQPLVFLEVVRRVVAIRPDVCAVIAGIGPLEPVMRDFVARHQLEGRVIFLGRRSDMATVFTAATLAMLCSRQEGTPNVLLEAQSLGCPVVSTRAGGATETVLDGKTGFLVDVGDVAGLQAAVTQLIANDSLRTSMSEAGPEFVRDRFGLDRMIRETISIYET
jgi:glycosyltransferase involved in cell wall biosynthesis